MLITALVLICCSALPDEPPVPFPRPTVIAKNTEVPPAAPDTQPALPDSPSPRINGNGDSSDIRVSPASSFLNAPVKPEDHNSFETPRKRRVWYGLMAASHAAAGFDAWTTREAVSGHYGVEADPLERPFSHSGVLYVSTQVGPVVMDYLGHRMMRSSHPVLRRMWWLPQAASASVSFGAGMHNYLIVH